MQTIITMIAERPLVRAVLLLLIGAPVAFFFLPETQRMHALYWIGFFTPGLAIAAIIGFLSWNIQWWLWSSVVAVLLTVLLIFR
jgi:hypothetical protein